MDQTDTDISLPPDDPQRHAADTAGRLAVGNVPRARPGEPVGELRGRLRSHRFACADLVLLTDSDGRYRGAVPLPRLLEAADDTPLARLAAPEWPYVAPDCDQEHAVAAATAAGVAVLPVVDREQRLVGVLPASVLLDVLAREHREDIHRLVGILHAGEGARHALEDPPLGRVLRRLPWLLVGLLLSLAAAATMASYERALAQNVMLAFFIPSLVYLTDAIGTQTEAVAVRGLSLRRRPLAYILLMEIATGATIGLALSLVAFLAVWLAFGSLGAALGVAISLFAAGTLASGLGLLLPWTLSRCGIDPAFGSGPVATILQDVATILIYFVVMTRLLPLGP